MENQMTTAEKIAFGESKRQSLAKEVMAKNEAQARADAAQAEKSLTKVEKATFGIASIFSGLVLVVLIMLTVVGFIFSPITDTLIFALLTGATGITCYVIWRGGGSQKNS